GGVPIAEGLRMDEERRRKLAVDVVREDVNPRKGDRSSSEARRVVQRQQFVHRGTRPVAASNVEQDVAGPSFATGRRMFPGTGTLGVAVEVLDEWTSDPCRLPARARRAGN